MSTTELDLAVEFGLTDDLLNLATEAELVALYEALEELTSHVEKWTFLPKQRVAEDHIEAGVDELLYGGAVGGGKSDWLLQHFYRLSLRFPGSKWLLIRRTFPELRRSLILRSWAKFDRTLAGYHVGDHVWTFKNGSTIEFGYCEADKDVYQYQSAEYDGIGVDEVTQFPTDFVWNYLGSRVRTTVMMRAMGLHPHMAAGTNPGGVGGLWVKMRWIDPAPYGEVFTHTVEVEGSKPRKVERVFVQSKLADNPYIDADQYRVQLAGLSPKIRQQLEDGNWDVIEGQFFDEWDRDVHVIRPMHIPDWWTRIGGYDFGFAAPACFLWAAFDPDGNCYVYREHYVTRTLPSDQATAILRAEAGRPEKPAERLRYRVADPSIWARTGAGPPLADQFSDCGVHMVRANNARKDGWARVREFLHLDPDTGAPSLFVFNTCPNLIRTLPMLVHDDVDPEDCDTDGEDHAPDALRYLLMSRPSRSRKARGPAPTVNEKGERLAFGPKHKNREVQTPVGRLRAR